MKLRNFLMAGAFLLAVGSSFAFKANKRFSNYYTINIGSATNPICDVKPIFTGCETFYTGPQCTAYYGGVLKPIYEFPIPASPPCVTPLREYKP
jgi:hypothetical protein